jgi:hypothetical protein
VTRALEAQYQPINLNVGSMAEKTGPAGVREFLADSDYCHQCGSGCHPFSEPYLIILVDPQGCAARFSGPLEIGAAVRLEGLPASANITARVVNCISMGECEKLWVLGLALDQPGHVWASKSPLNDWTEDGRLNSYLSAGFHQLAPNSDAGSANR